MDATDFEHFLAEDVVTQAQANDFIQGMLEGSLDIDQSYFIDPKWMTCFYDILDVLLDVVTGIRDLTSFDMKGLIMFLYAVSAALWKIVDVVDACNPLKEVLEQKDESAMFLSEIPSEDIA